jgi:hypothetical protein
MNWSSLHTASGTFNWVTADAYMAAHGALGHNAYWQVYGTPTWASSDSTHTDAYGVIGGSYPPATVDANGLYTELYNFVVALITRYKGQIQYIDPWNEPNFVGSFWQGTAAQMAKIARTVREAAKSVDPTIVVTSPSFNSDASCQAFMAASDGATGALTAQNGAWSAEVWSYHTYNENPFAGAAGSSSTTGIANRKAYLVAAGIANPIICVTEKGWTTAASTFFSLSQSQQADFIRRELIRVASQGVRVFMLYSYESYYCGYIVSSPLIQAAIGDVHDRFAGKTYTAIEQTSWGRMKCTTLDGSVLYF